MFRYASPRIATTRYGEGDLVSHDRATGGWKEAALFALAQALLWSLAFSLSYKAPALDGAEQFIWAFSLENGYWIHILAPLRASPPATLRARVTMLPGRSRGWAR